VVRGCSEATSLEANSVMISVLPEFQVIGSGAQGAKAAYEEDILDRPPLLMGVLGATREEEGFMNRNWKRMTGIAGVVVLALLRGPSVLAAPLPAVCVTGDAKSQVHFLDRDSLSVISSLDLMAYPNQCLFGRGGRTLAVVSFGEPSKSTPNKKGAGSLSWAERLKAGLAGEADPKGGGLAYIDLEKREISARWSLPGGISSVLERPGSGAIACAWNADRNDPGRLAIFGLDRQELAGAAVLPFAHPVLSYSIDGTRLFAMRSEDDPPPSKLVGSSAPPDLLVLDPASGATLREIRIGGRPCQSAAVLPEDEGIVVMAMPRSKDNPVSSQRPAIYRFGGSSPIATDSVFFGTGGAELYVDPHSGTVVSCTQDSVGSGSGVLHAFGRAGAVHAIPIHDNGPYDVVFASRDTTFIIGDRSVTAVDLSRQSVFAHIDLSFSPAQILPVRGSERIYVNEARGSKLAVADLARDSVIATLSTGRTSKRVSNVLSSVVMNTVGSLGHVGERFYGVRSGYTQMLMGRDGSRLYVLNTQTLDVNVVDTRTIEILRRVDTKTYNVNFMLFSADGSRLILCSREQVSWYDTATDSIAFSQTMARTGLMEDGDTVQSWAFDDRTGHAYGLMWRGLRIVDLADGARTKVQLPKPRRAMCNWMLIPPD
jgi:hypothetical protein